MDGLRHASTSWLFIPAPGWYNLPSAWETTSDMAVLWWLVSVVLVVLSCILLAAGIQGKQGTLRIGQMSPPEPPPPDQVPGPPPGQMQVTNVAVGIIGIVVGIAAFLVFAV